MSEYQNVIAHLGDGLVMRSATRNDSEALAEFNGEIFSDEQSGSDAWWIAEWTRDLLTKPHPTLKPEDVLIVEDATKSQIVSSTVYLSQQWAYQGIRFTIGRPEIVGTAPEYRNRGLIRHQFQQMHEWGQQRGHDVSVVLGIPYYYRQFGYELALDAEGDRHSNMLAMPRWGVDEKRRYRLRDAIPDDVPLMTRLLNESADRSLVSPVYKDDEVRYMAFCRSKRSGVHFRTGALCKSHEDEEAKGDAVGFIFYGLVLALDQAVILRIEMSEDKYWRLALPSMLREIEEKARLANEGHSDPEREIKTIRSDMQPNHPAYIFDEGALGPLPERQYAWYVMVPDLPGFMIKVSPVLERRLAASVHAGFSGSLQLLFSRDGIAIEFEDGAVKSVRQHDALRRQDALASFPGHSFLQLLFGRRSVEELVYASADCNVRSKSDAHLLETLFPKRNSDLSLTLT